jgi:hypothetical protein
MRVYCDTSACPETITDKRKKTKYTTKTLHWPRIFSFPPRVGDYVGSIDGEVILRIARVTHSVMNPEARVLVPMCVVQLLPGDDT